ncbi:precorrin-6A reductase [Desulfosarcina sp. OttesenSCG-928-A07]|nr:precorrin-6A reductase [Desulfosarcina sp. OttesenSCG-928-A07]
MNLLIFAGTHEGRLLCEKLADAGLPAVACTATAYGAECLSHLTGIRVVAGRKNASEMTAFIQDGRFDTVVDATHPYAREATENISAACAATGVRYIRLSRAPGHFEHTMTVPNTQAAAAYLAGVEGKALVTTGSKELHVYCGIPNYQKRLYVRVLPATEGVARCHELGFDEKHIIALHGPFSHELNAALLRQFDCRFLVTKNTGKNGGLNEKISAAESLGVKVILINRPLKEEGLSLDEVMDQLAIRKAM